MNSDNQTNYYDNLPAAKDIALKHELEHSVTETSSQALKNKKYIFYRSRSRGFEISHSYQKRDKSTHQNMSIERSFNTNFANRRN